MAKKLELAALLLVAVAIGLFLGTSRNAPNTVSANEASISSSKFQIVQVSFPFWDGSGNATGQQSAPFLLDTTTGRTWRFDGPSTNKDGNLTDAGGWTELSFPLYVLGTKTPKIFNTPGEFDAAVDAMKERARKP